MTDTLTRHSNDELKALASSIRQGIVTATHAAKSGHPGGSLSAADILTYLYFEEMNVDPANPRDPKRDRFVISKGHAAPGLYATLAERGFFDKAELETLRHIGSMLQGHPNMNDTPGVDMSTGSLGQGLSVANGMALAGRLDGKDYWVYVVLGDGEIQEGQVWEAAMSSAHYKLDHVIAFVDHNKLQIDGPNDKVMTVNPVDEKFAAFGWHVQVIDGNDLEAVSAAIDAAKAETGRPSVIVCETVKGKGVSFMEDQVGWHGKAPNAEQAAEALAELSAE